MHDARDVLANVLDDLSFRSSKAVQLAALQHIHTILADVCVGQSTEPRPWLNQLPLFLALQNDFETNIASRILGSGIVSASAVLRAVDEIRARGTSDRPNVSAVADVTALALSVLQGMALIHPRSKTYMGRKLSVQTLLDLLTALRHASANPDDPDATILPGVTTTDASLAASLSPLACSVIDTLLCLLVDSPSALRVFEECNGLEVIVRTLKKVIGQNVRMKCLEFLYFYLQDEEVLAITGTPIVNLPVKPRKSPAPAPTLALSVPTPTKSRTPQTPRRSRTHQVPATDTRPRTRAPVERTVSGDSTLSVLSSRSDAASEVSSTRSVSRASTASNSTARSNVTDSTTHSNTAEPERRFPRTHIMPSLSYSSSTVSSTSTNQTLDPHDPSPHDPQSRPVTPRREPTISLSEECYVPLPESPAKPRYANDDTPRRATRTREETPKAKPRQPQAIGDAPPLSRLNLFPAPAPMSTGPFGAGVQKKQRHTTPVGLSLLTGEIDYTPVSPTKPKAGEPAHTESKPTPKPPRDAGSKPATRRPRVSEILPRPALARTAPRNVSTPTTPTTPVVGSTPPTPIVSAPVILLPLAPATPTTPVVAAQDVTKPAVPVAATPMRAKRAVIPGGIRVPARSGSGSGAGLTGAGGGEGLRKSVGTEGLRRSQASSDGLRKSQVGGQELRKSQASSEGLRKSQASTENKDKTGALRLKKSTSSISATPRKTLDAGVEGGKKVAGEGARRVKEGRTEAERKESAETERKESTEPEKRPSLEVENNGLHVSVNGGAGAGGKVVRSSAEKKELLGAWLGNVDALVEGVQRAGVWGLR